jgi:hypothetical protein
MTTFTNDEVALIKSLLIALRGIKTRDLDKALAILSKGDRLRRGTVSHRLRNLARHEDEE